MSNPSYLIIENNPAIPNDVIIKYFLSLKKRFKLIIPNNKNKGSVNPKSEFSINLGEKINAAEQIIA